MKKKHYLNIYFNRHVFTNHSVFAVVRKNCDPFVLGPEFAIERMPEIKIFNIKVHFIMLLINN